MLKASLERGHDITYLSSILDYKLNYEECNMPCDDDENVMHRLEIEMLELKNRVNPFLPILQVLGEEPGPVCSELDIIPSALDCPSPSLDNIWNQLCYKYVLPDEITLKVQLIRTNPDPCLELIKKWREDRERQLVEWCSGANGGDRFDMQSAKVAIRGSTDITSVLSPYTRYLLCADTIFLNETTLIDTSVCTTPTSAKDIPTSVGASETA
ncbi:hypothetical protein RhiJN_22576 [Ceratobasidium sp. AG-Ba]|nr:hypothetical protein RhiJN_22576 [Ceratobasidium sp. AG-Ba]